MIHQSNNNYPYYSDAILSQQEIKMRNFLMYDFNISLKSMLIKYNFDVFDKYWFNCCRQTAVFGCLVLDLYYPDYIYTAYEATFKDKVFGRETVYKHCYIIAEHKEFSRRILIDMARTTSPLVFEPIIDDIHFYPNIDAYKDMKMLSTENIPYQDVYILNIAEFITGLPTQDFFKELVLHINEYDYSLSKAKNELIYSYPILKLEEFKKENPLLN